MPRFVVSEISGHKIDPAATPGTRRRTKTGLAPISVSVLDSAYCYREVARFDQSTQRPPAVIRQVARAKACELNEWDDAA